MMGAEIDPSQATSERFNRRVFVGLSAAATLAASAAAGAQEPLGQSHPPLVAENDPAISVEHVELKHGDAVIPAYAAWPISAGPGTPSVVVVMHVWGVDTSIRDVVRRLAKAGFAAIAPNLYARFGAPSGDGATDVSVFRPYAKRLDRNEYSGDIRAAALWLSAKFSGTKIGITGFCMGGRVALIGVDRQRRSLLGRRPVLRPARRRRPQGSSRAGLRQLRRARFEHSGGKRTRICRRAERTERHPRLRRGGACLFRRSARIVRGLGRGRRLEAHRRVF